MKVVDEFVPIYELANKTILGAVYGLDASGYPAVVLHFTDGSSFIVEEVGQCGSISYEMVVAKTEWQNWPAHV